MHHKESSPDQKEGHGAINIMSKHENLYRKRENPHLYKGTNSRKEGEPLQPLRKVPLELKPLKMSEVAPWGLEYPPCELIRHTERKLIAFIAKGYTAQEMAQEMGLSKSTVLEYLNRLRYILDVRENKDLPYALYELDRASYYWLSPEKY